jgi:hypothetical protein
MLRAFHEQNRAPDDAANMWNSKQFPNPQSNPRTVIPLPPTPPGPKSPSSLHLQAGRAAPFG